VGRRADPHGAQITRIWAASVLIEIQPMSAPNGGSACVLLYCLITQRDAGIGRGRSGQRRPPTSRRTEPQPAGPAVTFPGPGRLTGAGPLDDPGPAAGVPGRPGARAQVRDLIAASRPGSPPRPACCAVTRDQLHRQGAMGRCGMHDGRSTGATAIREDPVRCMCGHPQFRTAMHKYAGETPHVELAGEPPSGQQLPRSLDGHPRTRPCTAMAARCWASGAVQIWLFCRGRRSGA
jgi:hypothetical protein